MRPILFSLVLVLIAHQAGAQRFYYIETTNLVDQLIQKGLEKSNQYVVGSRMESEYTVRTKVSGGDDSKQLSLEIVLADSLTNKELFRSYEQFCFAPGNTQPQAAYRSAVRSFLIRRIGEMILTAKQDHAGLFKETMRARRDNI